MTTPPNQTNEERIRIRKASCHCSGKDCYEFSVRSCQFLNILDTKDSLHAQALKDALASQEERHKEIVICAAVIEEDGTIIRGHRHSDCFAAIQKRGKKVIKRDDGLTQQGFVTSRNRFVDRKEAMKIQKAAGIPSADPEGYRGSELYSEDLY